MQGLGPRPPDGFQHDGHPSSLPHVLSDRPRITRSGISYHHDESRSYRSHGLYDREARASVADGSADPLDTQALKSSGHITEILGRSIDRRHLRRGEATGKVAGSTARTRISPAAPSCFASSTAFGSAISATGEPSSGTRIFMIVTCSSGTSSYG
jgi:hypothetical protein